MKNANSSNYCTLTTASKKNRSGLLSLAAVLLCGLGVPTQAQNITRIAPEKGFTISPNVETPIVLKTKPDAVCDLHATGTSDTRSMRFYANGDGYLKMQASAREGIEGRFQLDCSAKGNAMSYPLHLRASSSPTSDMPTPQSVMPAPKGSKIRPALTEAQTQSLSDEELAQRGYPERPDPLAEPERYAKWQERVSRPMTILPTHLVATNVTATPGSYTSSNWSGLEARSTTFHKYSAISGAWYVPPIVLASSDGNSDYSAFWAGLDGNGTKDLVQAGTEQDAAEFLGILFTNYYAWSELLPNQPTEQEVFSVNAGDEITVEVWISTGSGAPNPNGGYAAFSIDDITQGFGSGAFYVPLSGTKYNGTEAEWIMERPTVGGSLPELADYVIANMWDAAALQVKGTKWVHCGTAANRDIGMWNGKDELSMAVWEGKGTSAIIFQWLNFQ